MATAFIIIIISSSQPANPLVIKEILTTCPSLLSKSLPLPRYKQSIDQEQGQEYLKSEAQVVTRWLDGCTVVNISLGVFLKDLGYWHQRADERQGNPPPRYPGAISGQRQSWKTPRWARGKQVHGMWYFSLQCFDTVGWVTERASGL